jgi:hypothetical protein
MFHAAGRKVYQPTADDFVALAPDEAARQGLVGKEVQVFGFEPMRASLQQPPATKTEVPEPAPGQLSAAYVGRDVDRVGTGSPEPDGRPDCCVRVLGLKPDAAIKNIVLTGPNKGRWEHAATGRWWRVAHRREGRQLDCYFQFYAPGEHQIEIVYDDGAAQSAKFQVPNVGGAQFSVELNPSAPNGYVFRFTDPRYRQIMASCLKNLLAGLGR